MIKRPKLEIDNRVLFRDKKAWLKSRGVRLLGCVVLGAAAVISILSFSV
jgi:Cys-tRNA synthase (O-phospho-L-seryl-tRNA:Cys-tRNA synthase)